jgi:hypothetical protein
LNSTSYLGIGCNLNVALYDESFNRKVDSTIRKQFYAANSFQLKIVPISPLVECRKRLNKRLSVGIYTQYIATPIVIKDANGGIFKGTSNLQVGSFFGF